MGRRLYAYPYHLWTFLFTVVPLALIVYFAFTARDTAAFTLDNLRQAAQPVYLGVLWHSVWLAGVSTFLCFLIGYPMAMILAKSRVRYRRMLTMLIVVPMWMNFLLRTYAWMTLLEKNGAVNAFLGFLGLPALHILYTDYAVLLGMVYNFLPFMILPIYSVLMKMDKSLLEAAADLGADGGSRRRRVDDLPARDLPVVAAGGLLWHTDGLHARSHDLRHLTSPGRRPASAGGQRHRAAVPRHWQLEFRLGSFGADDDPDLSEHDRPFPI